MLTITKLKSAEYVITAVAAGMEDYYMGAGEAPGVWQGQWADQLGLDGIVAADDLRALVDGLDPATGLELLAGHRERRVAAIDITLSVPKSVSLLWAFGTPETSAAVSIAVVEATHTALGFLEDQAAVARRQQGGVRRRVGTDGFAIATFAHRTSRAGDPQLHTHCLIPNVVRRADDGVFVAFDANPLHTWAKAAGTVFLNDLERTLTRQLGVEWGPDRNGCREMVGFSRDQLRTFSKRTVAIETHLEAAGELAFDSKRDRMQADEQASLATRQHKDKSLTPERLRDRWTDEAISVGLEPGDRVDDLVVGRRLHAVALTDEEMFEALVDPATGLCATESRFGEAHVVERVAAISAGRLDLDQIKAVTDRFLESQLIVRLAPDAAGRRPPQWSTVELRQVEDQLLADLDQLRASPGARVSRAVIDAAIAGGSVPLGDDQVEAVHRLCGPGPAVRAVTAPAGHGKTTALHAAVTAQQAAGRTVVVVAPTHKAVAELRATGLDAQTISRFRLHLGDQPIAPDTTVVVDELSQVATRDIAPIIGALASAPEAQLWCVGDAAQAQSVAAGGLAVEIDRLSDEHAIAHATLSVNRRQTDPEEQAALAALRVGDLESTRTIRADHGWDHEVGTAQETRHELAQAAVADADRDGIDQVAVLAVSHADCEDVADRIRTLRAHRGELRGPTLTGPGWGPDPRTYAAGDRILLHATIDPGAHPRIFNGATGTITSISTDGAQVAFDHGEQRELTAELLAGRRSDGTPNVSHGWARTVDGAQGGTWTQTHLLGTPTLDRFTGYVGHSRGRQPTHCWNTRPDAEHPLSLLADDRTTSDAVGDAMGRAEPKTLAATDDPHILDRRLRAERGEHTAILATRPPDPTFALDEARRAADRADRDHRDAVTHCAWAKRQRDQIGPIDRIRPGGRDRVARADQTIADADYRLGTATRRQQRALTKVEHLEDAQADRAAWDTANSWRGPRVAEIDDVLAHHWAEVTLRAVHADDPLAFGTPMLRYAGTVYRADLHQLDQSLPVDARPALERATVDLRDAEERLRNADFTTTAARADLQIAEQRHWGRRDKPAIDTAIRTLRGAENRLAVSTDALTATRDHVADQSQAVRAWTTAVDDTAGERVRLTRAINAIDDALATTLSERVTAAAHDPTSDLWDTLGTPPDSRGGRDAWCGIAHQLEGWRDRPPNPDQWIDRKLGEPTHPLLGTRPGSDGRDQWERVAALIDYADDIINIADQLDPAPSAALTQPADWHQAIQQTIPLIAEPDQPSIDHSVGLGL